MPIAIPVETYLKAPVILGAVIVRYIQSVSGELDPLQYGILGARARRNLSLLHAMISSQDQCNSLPCTRTVPAGVLTDETGQLSTIIAFN